MSALSEVNFCYSLDPTLRSSSVKKSDRQERPPRAKKPVRHTTPPPRSRDEAEPEEVAPGAEAAPEVAPEVDTPDSEAAATMADAV